MRYYYFYSFRVYWILCAVGAGVLAGFAVGRGLVDGAVAGVAAVLIFTGFAVIAASSPGEEKPMTE